MKYAALDFETAYWGPANACSLGIVVSDGTKIIDEWYHLIQPLSLNFDAGCMRVNGIHPEDVAGEDRFPAFWKDIADRLEEISFSPTTPDSTWGCLPPPLTPTTCLTCTFSMGTR